MKQQNMNYFGKWDKEAQKLCFADLTPKEIGYVLIQHFQALQSKIGALQQENDSLKARIKEKNRHGSWGFVDYSSGIVAKCSKCGAKCSGNDYTPFPKYCVGCGSPMNRSLKLRKLLEK